VDETVSEMAHKIAAARRHREDGPAGAPDTLEQKSIVHGRGVIAQSSSPSDDMAEFRAARAEDRGALHRS